MKKFDFSSPKWVKFYLDEKSIPCPKSVAKFTIIREMKEHTIVWQEKIKK